MKYTVFVNGLNNYSKWLLDAILNILDLTSLVDLDKFTQTDELIVVRAIAVDPGKYTPIKDSYMKVSAKFQLCKTIFKRNH